jgi:HNH endonuclease
MAVPPKPPLPCKYCGEPAERYRTMKGHLQRPQVCLAHRSYEGERHWHWRGGERSMKSGYVRVWTGRGKRDLEHRAVWIAAYGPIPKGMQLHHCNGDKTDNRLENLALVSNKGHQILHRHERALGERWSLIHKQCLACQTTERPHQARGLCKRCYERLSKAGLLT